MDYEVEYKGSSNKLLVKEDTLVCHHNNILLFSYSRITKLSLPAIVYVATPALHWNVFPLLEFQIIYNCLETYFITFFCVFHLVILHSLYDIQS